MKKQPNNNNNVETRKDIEEETKRILLAEERDDPEQVIINITPDILQQLQEEYDEMKEDGKMGPYRLEGYWQEKGQFFKEEEPPPECPFHKSEKDD